MTCLQRAELGGMGLNGCNLSHRTVEHPEHSFHFQRGPCVVVAVVVAVAVTTLRVHLIFYSSCFPFFCPILFQPFPTFFFLFLFCIMMFLWMRKSFISFFFFHLLFSIIIQKRPLIASRWCVSPCTVRRWCWLRSNSNSTTIELNLIAVDESLIGLWRDFLQILTYKTFRLWDLLYLQGSNS